MDTTHTIYISVVKHSERAADDRCPTGATLLCEAVHAAGSLVYDRSMCDWLFRRSLQRHVYSYLFI